MSKERRTVSLEKEVDDYLASEGTNASELVNQLVKNHVASGGDNKAMLELRESQLESEIGELESRVETKQDELDRVRAQLSEINNTREDALTEAIDVVSDLDDHQRVPNNAAVQTQAEKAGVTPQTLLDRVENEP